MGGEFIEICERSEKGGGGYQNQTSGDKKGEAVQSLVILWPTQQLDVPNATFPEKICCNFSYENLY